MINTDSSSNPMLQNNLISMSNLNGFQLNNYYDDNETSTNQSSSTCSDKQTNNLSNINTENDDEKTNDCLNEILFYNAKSDTAPKDDHQTYTSNDDMMYKNEAANEYVLDSEQTKDNCNENESNDLSRCEYCNKLGSFKGRFCNKMCIVNFARQNRNNRIRKDDQIRQKEISPKNSTKFKKARKDEVGEGKESNSIQTTTSNSDIKLENTINLPPLTDTINLCNLINLKKIDEPKFSNDFNMENRSNDIEIISEIKPIKSFNEAKIKKKKPSNLFKHKSESNLKKDSTKDKITIYKPIIRFDSSISNQETNVSPTKSESLDWIEYIKNTSSFPVPNEFFKNPSPSDTNNFKVGMALEGSDPKNKSLICVLTVVEVQGHRIRLHFDGYDTCYDFWRNADSKYIHPVGYCEKNNLKLNPPPGFGENEFEWSTYLIGKIAAPKHFFSTRKSQNVEENNENTIQIGMKLEAVDRYNPVLIRPATIVDIKKEKIKLHYDGMASQLDFWVKNDSEDIYPCLWCDKTGHKLTKPPNPADKSNCPTPGCNGLGNVRGPKYTSHHTESGCPYSLKNLNKEILPDRLTSAIANINNTNSSIISTKKIYFNTNHSIENHNNQPTINESNSIVAQKQTFDLNKAKSKSSSIKRSLNLNQEQGIVNSQKAPAKRGRPKKNLDEPNGTSDNIPSKKVKLTNNANNNEQSINEDAERLKEITESVYLAKDYENVDFYQTVSFKFDSQLCTNFKKPNNTSPKLWSIEQVSFFISSIPGCDGLAQTFSSEQIDGEALLLMEHQDLIKLMKLKLGPAIKIYNYIQKLKSSV